MLTLKLLMLMMMIDDNIERGLTNLPMGPSSSCGSSFDDEFDPFLMDDDDEEE